MKMEPFQLIFDLFTETQQVKSKYPAVVTYAKHLQKIRSDEGKREKEVDCFRSWLLKNPLVVEKTLAVPGYPGTKLAGMGPVHFDAIFACGKPELKESIWKRLMELELAIFPSGRPAPVEKPAPAEDMTPGAAAAMAVLEANPVFSDVIDNVKALSQQMDPNDLGAIVESKEFGKLMENIKHGLKSGKYKMSDLTGTISAVTSSIQDELDPETRSVVSSATSMLAEAERGGQPDVAKLLNMMKNLNFK